MNPTGTSPHRGGRPRVSTRRERVNITLHPEVRDAAARLAFTEQRSLSSLVELCLRREIERASAAVARTSDSGAA